MEEQSGRFAPSAFLNGWSHFALLAPLPTGLPSGPRFGSASGQTSAAGLYSWVTWIAEVVQVVFILPFSLTCKVGSHSIGKLSRLN